MTRVGGGALDPPPTLGSRVLLLDLGEGEDIAAQAPAAVDDLVDEHHGVVANGVTEGLGVEVGDLLDEDLLLLGGLRARGDLEVGERHGLLLFRFLVARLVSTVAWPASGNQVAFPQGSPPPGCGMVCQRHW